MTRFAGTRSAFRTPEGMIDPRLLEGPENQ